MSIINSFCLISGYKVTLNSLIMEKRGHETKLNPIICNTIRVWRDITRHLGGKKLLLARLHPSLSPSTASRTANSYIHNLQTRLLQSHSPWTLLYWPSEVTLHTQLPSYSPTPPLVTTQLLPIIYKALNKPLPISLTCYVHDGIGNNSSLDIMRYCQLIHYWVLLVLLCCNL